MQLSRLIGLQNRGSKHRATYRRLGQYENNFLLANPETLQSLTDNPRNIDAKNDDKTLNIDNHDIRKTEQLKLLGVYIEQNINFASQRVMYESQSKSRNTCTSAILIPCNAKLMLYKTFIMPYLTYCHLVWKFCKSSDSRKIKRIQVRALRAVSI